jgi:LPS sulfotransferase NodH
MTDLPPLTIVICATPRTGSTRLCALPAASGVGGRPDSWWRAEDVDEYVQDWEVPRGPDGQPNPLPYRAAAIRAGSSPNGVFGLRIQAQTLPTLLAELGARPGGGVRAMEAAFGPCHYIHIRREDDVAQAISRLKAEVSQVWHLDGTESDPAGRASYDAGRLDAFRAEAADGNATWEKWFATEGIAPHRLVYESFSIDPAAHVRRLLAAFGLKPAPGTLLDVPNRKMADTESAIWAARYRVERGLVPITPGVGSL